MQNNRLSSFLWGELCCVQHQFSFQWWLIRIGNAGKVLNQAFSCLGIESLAVTLLANLQRRIHIYQHEAAKWLSHLANLPPHTFVRRDWGTDRDTAVLRNFGCY